jgi:hypothetical protein
MLISYIPPIDCVYGLLHDSPGGTAGTGCRGTARSARRVTPVRQPTATEIARFKASYRRQHGGPPANARVRMAQANEWWEGMPPQKSAAWREWERGYEAAWAMRAEPNWYPHVGWMSYSLGLLLAGLEPQDDPPPLDFMPGQWTLLLNAHTRITYFHVQVATPDAADGCHALLRVTPSSNAQARLRSRNELVIPTADPSKSFTTVNNGTATFHLVPDLITIRQNEFIGLSIKLFSPWWIPIKPRFLRCLPVH